MSDARAHDLGQRWQHLFIAALQAPENSGPLKEAALTGKLGAWTKQLTAVLVRSCHALGWSAAAKGHSLNLLPQSGQEYLGIDLMAFEPLPSGQGACWRFPVGVFELENSRDDDRVAYSLWKVLCLSCRLRVVFAYRRDWQEARQLVGKLSAAVVAPMQIQQRDELCGQTLIVVGSRGEGETFPWGYFKLWELFANLGRFEKL